MIETIISDVLHRMIKDLSAEQEKQLETTLHIVLNKYEITEVSHSEALFFISQRR